MFFSVVVPFLNEERHIEKCTKALLNQKFDRKEYEIIFIDNGATDRSPEIVRKFQDVILLREDKKGPYAARNRGLEIAKGEIIAFTDSDCEVSDEWLLNIRDGMNGSNAAIVLGRCNFFKEVSPPLKVLEDYENSRTEYFLSNSMRRYYYAYTNNMAVRSEIFKKIGFFDEWHRGADTAFIHRCINSMPNLKEIYLNNMQVLHLEISNVKAWLKKQYLYGKHAETNIVKDREFLGTKVFLGVYVYCVKKNNFNFRQRAMLLFLLLIGRLLFETGRAKQKLCFWG